MEIWNVIRRIEADNISRHNKCKLIVYFSVILIEYTVLVKENFPKFIFHITSQQIQVIAMTLTAIKMNVLYKGKLKSSWI